MIADILTKATPKPIFTQLRPNLLGLSYDNSVKTAMLMLHDVFTSGDGVDIQI
jgi:hypothetical protein